MEPAPPISIIVFVRNAAATIEQALQSVLSQGVPGTELIVLDGGSTDGTQDVIRRYQRDIAFFRSGPDGGGAFAIAEGIERARGDVIGLLPADDWLEPNALRTVVEAFAADPQLEILSCGTRIVQVAADGSVQVEREFLSAETLEFSLEKILDWPLTCGRFVRRSLYRRVGNYDPRQRVCDLEFLVRAYFAGVRSKVSPALAYTFRRHAGSDSLGGNPGNVLALTRATMALLSGYLARDGLSSRDRLALLRIHGWSAAHAIAILVRSGRVSEAASTAARAIAVDLAWPARAARWLGRRILLGKGQPAR